MMPANPRDQFSPFYQAVVPGSYIGWGQDNTAWQRALAFRAGCPALHGPEADRRQPDGRGGLRPWSASDLETAVRCDLPILTVVMRNNVPRRLCGQHACRDRKNMAPIGMSGKLMRRLAAGLGRLWRKASLTRRTFAARLATRP